MGHIIDLVPNHMGIAQSANPWWQDVLENGPSSRYAAVFDIDWHPLKPELENKVLLPILGDCLRRGARAPGDRSSSTTTGAFRVRYFEHMLPIAPAPTTGSSARAATRCSTSIGADSDDGIEFLSILTAIRHLPGRQTAGRRSCARNAIARRKSSSGGWRR